MSRQGCEGNVSWPAATTQTVSVDNELWRNWDETSTPRIEVVQTIPATIADIAIPPLSAAAGAALAAADAGVAALNEVALGQSADLGYLSAVLLRADAVASSQIEDITATAEPLAVAYVEDDQDTSGIDEATTLVAAHVAVTVASFRQKGPITAEWMHRQQSLLLRHDHEILRRHIGAWRDCAVWIGETRAVATFEGPPHELVPGLIEDLVAFSARPDIHPIMHAAIAHAQFETIHPYVDGNGRVGRLLIHQLLRSGKAPVPVAHGLLHDTGVYVDGLTAYRSGDLDAWIEIFANAVTEASSVGARLVRRLNALRVDYRRRVRTRGSSATHAVLVELIEHPALTASDLRVRHNITAARASQILNRLNQAGIVRRSSYASGRERVWVADDVIHVMDTINDQPRRTIN